MPPQGKRKLIKDWWWVFSFVAICLCFYGQGMNKKGYACFELKKKIAALQHDRDHLAEHHVHLQDQIGSHNDPAWIELVLMKHLGVVPEGQVKVHFKHESVGN